MIRLVARTRLTALALICVLALGSCSGSPDYTGHDIEGVMPDLAFTLTRAQSQTVTADDYDAALTLLYFGYTYCPDVCPATMARIHAAMSGLDPAQRDQVEVLFVSVDPKRDTPKRLQQYASSFGPEFIGLTGSQEQLRALTKRYRVTYGYGEPSDNGYYTVSHSGAVFVFDAQGHARLLVNQQESVDQLTADLRKLLAQAD